MEVQDSARKDEVMDNETDDENEVIILAPSREELVEIARVDQV